MRKALVGLLGVVALVSVTPAAHAAFPGINGKIAYYTHPGFSDDIWVMGPTGSGNAAITGPAHHERDPAWSPDGTKIALVADGDIWTMNADGSGMVNVTNFSGFPHTSPNWSPDGSKIVLSTSRSGDIGTKIYVIDADGSDLTRLTNNTPELSGDSLPAWSPDGRYIAFVRNVGGHHIFRMKPDGTEVTQITGSTTTDVAPSWSPGGARIAYTRFTDTPGTTGIHTMDFDGSNDVDLSSFLTEAHDPAWSPDGSKLVVSRNLHVWTMNTNGTSPVQLTTVAGTNGLPDWQPLPFTGYARPKAAKNVNVPLVPAFDPCTAPNRVHGPPLESDSCNPPAQASPNLTVGTPDAGGGAANSTGSFLIRAVVGTPGPPEDSGARIDVSLTDVRCEAGVTACGSFNTSGGADYTGELRAEFNLQMTDKWNATAAGGGPDPATVTDFTFPVPVPCSQTASIAEGGNCVTHTDALVIYPGLVKDGKRAVWEMGQVQVLDGGPDGDIDTADNSLFAVQGLFVP